MTLVVGETSNTHVHTHTHTHTHTHGTLITQSVGSYKFIISLIGLETGIYELLWIKA